MRKRGFAVLLFSLVLIAGSAITLAQDYSDSPPSLCRDGSWICGDDNLDRAAWNWSCGWYWGHYYAHLYTANQIPDWCNPPLDSDGDGIGDDLDRCPYQGGAVDTHGCPISKTPPGPIPGTCYQSFDTPSFADQYYLGPLNTPANAETRNYSTDGTCSGPTIYFVMWVQTSATTWQEAVNFCNSIGSGYDFAENLALSGYQVPADMWYCWDIP